jgi:catechol 2,3-dioxygenase-like lactoylglutathione lyase family enzyme
MIGYTCLGTNDLERAGKFYDHLMDSIGAKRLKEAPVFIAWSSTDGAPALMLIKPNDGGAATVGNGAMVAFGMDDHDKIDAFHAKALELGATDEGAPGFRGETFYAAYFRDPDGHKVCAYNAEWLA